MVTISCPFRNRVSGRSWTIGASTRRPSWSTPSTSWVSRGSSGSGSSKGSVTAAVSRRYSRAALKLGARTAMRNPLARRPGVPEPSRDPRPGRTPRRGGPGVLGWPQRIVVGAVVAVLLGWVLLFYVMAPKLPDPRELRAQSEQPTITVLAADGSVLARRGTEGGGFIDSYESSPW